MRCSEWRGTARLSIEGLSLKCIAGEEIRFVYQYVGVVRYLDRHQIEFFMTLLIRLCRHLTGLRLAPSRARIMHRRSNPAGSELAAYFGGKITFGASADELIFVGNIKDIKVTSADPYLTSFWWRIASKRFLIDVRTKARSAWR